MVSGMCTMLTYGTGICCYAFIYFKIFIASVHSFFILLKKSLVLVNRRNGPQYQRVQALSAFFNRGGTENFVFGVCVCFVFYVNLCTGLILWFLNNLWFDDLRAE